MLARWLTLAAATFVALLATGCETGSSPAVDPGRVTGSAAPTQSTPAHAAKVSVIKTGFGADGYGSTEAVALVANPTANVVEIQVNFAAYDAGGKVLDTESGAVVLVGSHDQQVLANDLSLPEHAKIDHVDAQVSVSDSEKDQHPSSRMKIASPQVRAQAYGGFTTTGTIDSTYVDTVTNVYVGAMCLNAAGQIIGGGDSFLDANVLGGGKTPVKVDVTTTKKPARCLVTATPSNLSDTA